MLIEAGEERAAALVRWQPPIERSAQVALEFNDRYAGGAGSLDLSGLDLHLSRLGAVLASRFDAEDRVLAEI